jgi:hypothetical protein
MTVELIAPIAMDEGLRFAIREGGPYRVTKIIKPAESPRSSRPMTTSMATKAIVGEKVGMTQVWDDEPWDKRSSRSPSSGRALPHRAGEDPRDATATAPSRSPSARRPKKLTKPVAGHFAKAGVEPGRRLVELRLDDVSGYEVGQEITVDELAEAATGRRHRRQPRARASPVP